MLEAANVLQRGIRANHLHFFIGPGNCCVIARPNATRTTAVNSCDQSLQRRMFRQRFQNGAYYRE